MRATEGKAIVGLGVRGVAARLAKLTPATHAAVLSDDRHALAFEDVQNLIDGARYVRATTDRRNTRAAASASVSVASRISIRKSTTEAEVYKATRP